MKSIRTVSQLIVSILSLFLLGCDGFTSAHGRVLDSAGKPVSGAIITLGIKEIDGEPVSGIVSQSRSSDDGKYSVMISHGGLETKVEFQVAQTDYHKHIESITTGSSLDDHDVTLYKLDEVKPQDKTRQ